MGLPEGGALGRGRGREEGLPGAEGLPPWAAPLPTRLCRGPQVPMQASVSHG